MLNRNTIYAMRPWARWQSWCNLVLGIILFIAPWYTATWNYGNSSWNSWIFGVLTVLVALWALAMRGSIVPTVINLIIGIWVFISPWALGYAGVSSIAWSAWIIGALVIIFSAWAIAVAQRPPTTAAV